LPRQNEWVNEIWICDKGRFAYHYAESKERLAGPLARVNGELAPVSWEEAVDRAAQGLGEAREEVLALTSGRLANEDLFTLKELAEALGGKCGLYTEMAGGDLVAQVGVGQGTNLSDLGEETAILVVASDLEEEAPIYWLRVKQAAERGAKLIVANPRPTKIDRAASQTLRYPYGAEAAMVLALVNALSPKRPDLPGAVRSMARPAEIQAAAKTLAEAENAIVFFGSEGTGLSASRALAQACANLLIATNHTGRPNNGLIGVWPRANDQGAWELGLRPIDDLNEAIRTSRALYVAGADPAGDDPGLIEAIESAGFLVVQDLFLTETAKLADVVLPARSFLEREGTLTNAERRVQRYYPAIPAMPPAQSRNGGGKSSDGGTLPDYLITARVARALGIELEGRLPVHIMERIAARIPAYAGVSYKALSEVVQQWPIIARADLYYGGTSYENSQGLGVQLKPASESGEQAALAWLQPPELNLPVEGELLAVPATRLYDRGQTLMPSRVLHERIPEPYISLHPDTARTLGVGVDRLVRLELSGSAAAQPVHPFKVKLDKGIPTGVALVPRSMGLLLRAPAPIKITALQNEPA
jgi:NADH-quinone oxidoreductase subunit G